MFSSFLSMATMAECSAAIHGLNGFKVGGHRMNVEFRKSQAQKEKDLREKQVWHTSEVILSTSLHVQVISLSVNSQSCTYTIYLSLHGDSSVR